MSFVSVPLKPMELRLVRLTAARTTDVVQASFKLGLRLQVSTLPYQHFCQAIAQLRHVWRPLDCSLIEIFSIDQLAARERLPRTSNPAEGTRVP